MISNPDLIFYACIAHKVTILGEISKEPGLGNLAQQCVEVAPPHHSMFSHTLKSGFEDVSGSGSILVRDNFAPSCLQVQFDSIIRKVMASDSPNSPAASRNLSFGASKGKKMVLTPLLGKNPSEGLKKKRRLSGEVNGDPCKDVTAMEKKVDVCDDANGGGFRDFPLPTQKSGLLHSGDRQKAKQVWRRHVWVVLILDLFVCAVLFGIWLWVCRGFKCIDS
ncbi:phytolongin Phyl2.2 [Pyrus x bretschneideri]|uniref:phytolongin Phyl2.2 n=1 Tax=Pyrus x bretschneideri TaxID=225117 RepID=UPI00203086E4|nr:phytolongin Phyl2.2 [Pyrus x bretschneideri]